MTEIEDPYCDSQLFIWSSIIDDKHEEVLSIGRDCYSRLCSRLSGVKYEAQSSEEIMYALCARVLELSAFALRCARFGSVPSAKILGRSILEASYKICALQRDAKNLDQLVSDDNASRLQLSKMIHKYKKDKGAKHFAKGVEKKIDELAELKATKIDPSDWADLAGMTDFHRLFYPWLCSDTHTNVAALDRYFAEERDYALEIGPGDDDLPMTIMIFSRCLVVVLKTLEASTDEAKSDWYTSIEARLMALEKQGG